MTSIICKLHHIQKFCTISWRKGHNPCCKFSTTVDHHEIQTKYNNLKGKQKNLLTSSQLILMTPCCCESLTLNLSVRVFSITQACMKSSKLMFLAPRRSNTRTTVSQNWGDLCENKHSYLRKNVVLGPYIIDQRISLRNLNVRKIGF